MRRTERKTTKDNAGARKRVPDEPPWITSRLVLRAWLGCFFALLALFARARDASAHPILEDRLTLRAERADAIELVVTSSVRTLSAALGREPRSGAFYSPEEIHQLAADAGPYLLAHLGVEADGRRVALRVMSTEPDRAIIAPVHRLADSEKAFVVHHLSGEVRSPPRRVRLDHTMLEDVSAPGGARWVVDYIVDAGGATHVLRPNAPLDITVGAPPSAARVFMEFFTLGVTHILAGLDHLLFLAAVVLGASELRTLIAVVLAFTLAHTTTLALATFSVVSMPSRVVEPLIGLSIVLAAGAALRAPERTSMWLRRSAGGDSERMLLRASMAFGFGLVHGLGFAQGLVDALHGDRARIVLALVAFTLGVELVQQGVVVPVYLLAKKARGQGDGPALQRRRAWLERATLAVLVLGLLFMFQALKRAT